MRSRYTAFATGALEHLDATLAPEAREGYDPEETAAWARESRWQGLEIVAVEAGGAEDAEGVVEFIARFRHQGQNHAHHERATFRRGEDGRWLYVDGATPKPQQRVVGPKTGRNDPCPCGSGKKFKKCCGAG